MPRAELLKEEFELYSDPVNAAGFEWKLSAHVEHDLFGLALVAYPPTFYNGPYNFDVKL